MANHLTDYPQRLEFDTVNDGDQIVITTGHNESAWRYDFSVDKAGYWPQGMLSATNPTGEVSPAAAFALHGCGRWTTRRENPVQTQDYGFTPYYNGLLMGSLVMAKHRESDERMVFGRQRNDSFYDYHPGDEISAIAHTSYRHNAILDVLIGNGALSVSAVSEALSDAPIELTRKNIRATLEAMVKSGRVSLLRKKVMLFEVPEAT